MRGGALSSTVDWLASPYFPHPQLKPELISQTSLVGVDLVQVIKHGLYGATLLLSDLGSHLTFVLE